MSAFNHDGGEANAGRGALDVAPPKGQCPPLFCVHTVSSLNRAFGGPSYVVSPLCDTLIEAGAKVEVVTQGGIGACGEGSVLSPALARVNKVPDLYLLNSRIASASTFGRVVANRCNVARAQLIHSHGLWLPSNHAVAVVARRARVPLVVSPHGMLEPWALMRHAWKKRLAWWLYQRRDLESACVLHATAEQEAGNFRRLGLRQPIAVIPNGVHLLTLSPRPKEPNQTRTALFLGRIHPVKGLVELVEAWAKVRPMQWRLLVVGPDEAGHRRVVEAAVRRADLQGFIEIREAVDGVAKTELYRSTNLFILPSFTENFGVVVAEALACEVPVITTKGTPWQGLERHRCGWWIDIGVEPLAATIRLATSLSDEEMLAMGRRGREYVAREFGWPGIAEQMLAVYRWMLRCGPRPDCIRVD